MKKIVLLVFVLVLLSTAVVVGFIRPVGASGTIIINADGSVYPSTANITTVDKVTYTFNDNIYDSIVIERDNIVVDGAGYTLQGTESGKGIDLSDRSNITIKNMRIKAFNYGIHLSGSSNNNISGNNIINNGYYGICLLNSSNNNISENNITNNTNNGIVLYYSSNNFLQSNLLDGNQYGLGFLGLELSHFLHSIDSSNLVEGKPVYYLISKHGISINPSTHPEVGFLALINSTNITIEGLTLTKNRLGLLIAYTNNTKIQNNNMTNNVRGIWLYDSSNNTISGNSIRMNSGGIVLSGSSNNTISGSNITLNAGGIELFESSNNIIYHNNFMDNTPQVDSDGFTNVWDDSYPSGGNYWSDYTGVDVKSGPNQDQPSSDSIGDTRYIIDGNNQDNYPLMYPWDTLPPPSYTLTIYSSSTGVTFTVDGVPRTTPWSGTYSKGASVSLVMPETHDGHVWSHWVEDGAPNRIKTVTIDTNTTLTAEFTPGTASQQEEAFPTWIVATIIIAVVGASLLTYFAKVKKPTGKAK